MQGAGHRPPLQGARGRAGVPERLWGNAADASVGLTRGLGGTASCLPRTLVEVQCLGHRASTAGGTGSIPGQGIKTRPAVPGVRGEAAVHRLQVGSCTMGLGLGARGSETPRAASFSYAQRDQSGCWCPSQVQVELNVRTCQPLPCPHVSLLHPSSSATAHCWHLHVGLCFYLSYCISGGTEVRNSPWIHSEGMWGTVGLKGRQ